MEKDVKNLQESKEKAKKAVKALSEDELSFVNGGYEKTLPACKSTFVYGEFCAFTDWCDFSTEDYDEWLEWYLKQPH